MANKDTLVRHIAAENSHDLDGTLATLHPACVFRDHATQQVWRGREGAADHYIQFWSAFDVAVERDPGQLSFWKGEDIYVAQALWRGTHIGPFMGLPASGKAFTHPFTVFVEFEDGLMKSEEFFYDLSSLLSKLGGVGVAALERLPHRAAP